mmetsp:Transcript_41877/g.87915  ORF Transcript_41877/g.87915 Transcript_41877/m.87915 type:complete len:245 (-) Transcript_41877:360-1094(-)
MLRLLELVLQFALFLQRFLILRDEVEGLPEVVHGLVVIHVEQQRLGPDEVGLLSGIVGHHHGIVVVRRRAQFHRRVAVRQCLLVLAHAAQYGALFELDATPKQGGIDVKAPHGRETIVHESRCGIVVSLLNLFLGLIEEFDHLFQSAVLFPGAGLFRIEFEHILVEGDGVFREAELHGGIGAEGRGHHFGIVVLPRIVLVGGPRDQFAGPRHGLAVVRFLLVTTRLDEEDVDGLVRGRYFFEKL